jgi:hypothetical protein
MPSDMTALIRKSRTNSRRPMNSLSRFEAKADNGYGKQINTVKKESTSTHVVLMTLTRHTFAEHNAFFTEA